jgi:hypothetical protein
MSPTAIHCNRKRKTVNSCWAGMVVPVASPDPKGNRNIKLTSGLHLPEVCKRDVGRTGGHIATETVSANGSVQGTRRVVDPVK